MRYGWLEMRGTRRVMLTRGWVMERDMLRVVEEVIVREQMDTFVIKPRSLAGKVLEAIRVQEIVAFERQHEMDLETAEGIF
jgi:hypothetical protein